MNAELFEDPQEFNIEEGSECDSLMYLDIAKYWFDLAKAVLWRIMKDLEFPILKWWSGWTTKIDDVLGAFLSVPHNLTVEEVAQLGIISAALNNFLPYSIYLKFHDKIVKQGDVEKVRRLLNANSKEEFLNILSEDLGFAEKDFED